MIHSLLHNARFIVQTTALISTQDTDIDGSQALDMSGYNNVIFMYPIIASSNTTDGVLGIILAASASSGGTYADCSTATGAVTFTSTAANVGDDTLIIADFAGPFPYRWVRPTVYGSSEMMHGSCISIQYNPRKGVVSQSTATDGVAHGGTFFYAGPTT